jgi:dynein heavy chain, axonemal
LELINTFKTLLDIKRKEVMALKNRYADGYDCLVSTEAAVNIMQEELEALLPEVI